MTSKNLPGPFCWVGAKNRMRSKIAPILEEARRGRPVYVEPFGGSAVALSKRSESKNAPVAETLGKITSVAAQSAPGGHTLDFEVDNKRYSGSIKPTAARYLGGVGFTCMSDDGGDLSVSPESGGWEERGKPRKSTTGTRFASTRESFALALLCSALVFARKTEEEIDAIRAAVPTRAEALERWKANRFATAPLDDEAAWRRVYEAEDAREFEGCIFDCLQRKTEDF